MKGATYSVKKYKLNFEICQKIRQINQKVTRMELIFRQSCSLKACKFHKTALLYMFFSNIFFIKITVSFKDFSTF